MLQNSSFDAIARSIAVSSIDTYTRISPRKGYSCPHRLLHGGESCSKYVKNLLLEQSLVSAVKLSYERFTACTSASNSIRAIREIGSRKMIPEIAIPGCIPCCPCT